MIFLAAFPTVASLLDYAGRVTFPLAQDGRVIRAVPGSRRFATVPTADEFRAAIAKIDPRVLFPLADEPDDDPLLGPLLAICKPCLHVPGEMALLPPSLRFNRNGKRVFAATKWMNGVTGFVLAPSEFRPGLAVWGFSESGLRNHEEYATPMEWLIEFIAGLEHAQPGDPEELWHMIEGDLPNAEPPLSLEPPIIDGTWTHATEGVVDRQEEYQRGKRHGSLTWWHVLEELPADTDISEGDFEFTYRQGPIIREGRFEAGAAHGPFRFFTERGKPSYEADFVRGFPSGECIVHPEATLGICEPATIRYEAGVPIAWTVPEYAYSSVRLDRDGKPPASLLEIAHDEPVVLVNCFEAREHPCKDEVDVAVVGVAAEPGRGKLGDKAIEIVGDRDGKLTRAYGHANEKLLPVTLVKANGAFAGAGQLAHALRNVRKRLYS